MENKIFLKELAKIGIILTKVQEEQLEKYYTLLIKTNESLNLTAITEKKDVYLKHFYDSLTLVKATNLNEDLNICDIGTGAGFPGLVLKIIFPHLKITLVDALEKRIKFLKLVIKELNLSNIEAIHSRIEDLPLKEHYDLVVSRAVAKTNTLLELGCQLPKINGYFLLMKSNVTDEIKEATIAIKTLNYQLEDLVSFTLPIEDSKRTIIKLKKIDHTSSKYPRDFAQIKKKPL